MLQLMEHNFYDRPQEVAMVNSISTFYLMETLEECKNSLNKKLKLFFLVRAKLTTNL